MKISITESQMREIVKKVISELRDTDLEMKRENPKVSTTSEIESFVKSTFREFTAPFEAFKESLFILATIAVIIEGAPAIAGAISSRVILTLAFEIFNVYLAAEIATDGLMRMIPLFKAVKEGNRRRAAIMALNIVADSAQLAILARTGSPVSSKDISKVVNQRKFDLLGRTYQSVINLLRDLAGSRSVKTVPVLASSLAGTATTLAEGYVFLKLDSKEEFADAFAETFYPDDIDPDAILEEYEKRDEQNRKDAEEIDMLAKQFAKKVLSNQ